MLDNYRKGIYLLKDTVLESRQIIECLNRFFAFSYHGPDVNSPLWYLRTLIVISLFAPLFLIIYKKSPTLFIILGSGIGLFLDMNIPYLCINIDHVAWFILGIGLFKGKYLELIIYKKYVFLFLIIICWILSIFIFHGILFDMKFKLIRGGHNIIAFLGVISIYSIVSIIEKCPKIFFPFSNTFWIYCCHFPICMWIKSIGRHVVHENDYGLLLVAILTPILTLLLCVIFQKTIQRLSPNYFALLNEGR